MIIGRLWRPHHRLPPLCRTGRHAARPASRRRATACIELAPDLAESLAQWRCAPMPGSSTCADAHIERRDLDMPQDPAARAIRPDPALPDRAAAGASTSAAHRHRFGDLGHRLWRRFRLDRHPRAGCAAASRSTATASPPVPGLYFLGLQWLSRMNSSFLSGVGDDAAVLADHIAARQLIERWPRFA